MCIARRTWRNFMKISVSFYAHVFVLEYANVVVAYTCVFQHCNRPSLRCLQPAHWGRDKMAAISQKTFLNASPWMKMYEFRLRLHWSLFLGGGPNNNFPALVQIMAWRRPGDKAWSELMMVSLLMHICVTRPQWALKKEKLSSRWF